MIQVRDLEKIDTKSMFKIYDEWPEIARKAFETKFAKFDAKNIICSTTKLKKLGWKSKISLDEGLKKMI